MDEERRRGNNSARRNQNVDMVMEKERGNCTNPSHCDYMRNRRSNRQPEDSTEVLYMMPNFEPTPSEQEKFYDCMSEHDYPYEGSVHGKPNERFDDPEAFRIALQRAADAAQTLLRDLDNKQTNKVACPGGQQMGPCAANLEITARMTSIGGSQENDIRCSPFRVRIEPITFKIPIKLDVMGASMTSTGAREPILTATVEGSHYSGPQTDSDRYNEDLSYPDEEHPNDQRSQTDASYLQEQKRNSQRQKPNEEPTSDDALDPNAKKSQTDTSFLKDKAIREGRIRPEGQQKQVSMKMDESSEPGRSGRENPIDDISAADPNAKPSQTDTSFLRDKRMGAAGEASQDQQADENNRISFTKPDRMKYPTNYRTTDEGELDDEKVSNEVICRCSNTNELKIDNKLKGVSSDDEIGEKGCKCKTQKSGYDDGIEDLCTPSVMKQTCDGRRRSDTGSNEEVHQFEDRQISFFPDDKENSHGTILKQKTVHHQDGLPCCSAANPCAAPQDYDSENENRSDILILSHKEIKSRGGFKPKHGDIRSKSWYTYGERPTISSSQQQPGSSGQYGPCGHNYGDDDDSDDGEGFHSCESETETSVVCRCTPEHNCRHDKSMPCICHKRSAKSVKSETSNYKSSCSFTPKRSDGKNMKSNDNKKQCDCGKEVRHSLVSNMTVSSQRTCGICGKRESYKDNRSARSSASTHTSPCGICGLEQSSQQQRVSKANAPCGGQSSSAQHPPCDECQEEPEICGECGKKVEAKDSCSHQNSEDDKPKSCYCSTHSLTCRDDPAAPCHTISSRKEKIMRLINNLTDVANCTGTFAEDRPVIIEQLFQELTYLLGRDVTTTDDIKEKNLECCLLKMQEYLNECFLKDLPPSKKKRQIGKIVLYNVERDPDFFYAPTTTTNASKHIMEVEGEEEHAEEESSVGGGKGDGTSGDGGEEEGGDTDGLKVNIVNIGDDPIAGECADCESVADTFFGDCAICEEDTQRTPCGEVTKPTEHPPCGEVAKPTEPPPCGEVTQPTECGACEEVTQPTDCNLCDETTPAPTDCNICDEIKPAPTDCNICEEEMRMVRSGGPCQAPEPECGPCQCCHCRALRSEKECHTVTKTVECAMLDPVCELRYFIDSIIFDLDAMDHVLHDKKSRTKAVKPKKVNDPCKDTFPVQITQCHDIGMTSLFVSWEIFDCCGIGGYEIYIDGQLSNRLFSPCHQATVLCNVNINKEHQIVLRATPIGAELPGEGGKGCSSSKAIARRSQPAPDRGPGSSQPWKASVFYYHPC